MQQLLQVPQKLKRPLGQLSACRFNDIYNLLAISKTQLELTQCQLHEDPLNIQLQNKEKAYRDHYLDLLDSSIKLMRQQSKLEWLNSGDHYTKLFFTKMKQRKQANYICSINDATGTTVDGFSAVAKTLTGFYQQLLGKQKIHRTCVS